VGQQSRDELRYENADAPGRKRQSDEQYRISLRPAWFDDDIHSGAVSPRLRTCLVEGSGMAVNALSLGWGKIVSKGAIAGIVGGIVIALFLFVALGLLPVHLTPVQILTSFAHYIHAESPVVGLLAHLVVSILWGIGYAYVAATRPAAVASPWLAGVVYGLIVWLLMQFILILGAVWPGLTPIGFVVQIVAHTAFFGIPVAFTTRALARR